jgi:hypothetical protein
MLQSSVIIQQSDEYHRNAGGQIFPLHNLTIHVSLEKYHQEAFLAFAQPY